jgi:hypothetical protein
LDGDPIELIVDATHRYTLPINARPRPSSVVIARVEGKPVVGVVNDWLDDLFPADYPVAQGRGQ